MGLLHLHLNIHSLLLYLFADMTVTATSQSITELCSTEFHKTFKISLILFQRSIGLPDVHSGYGFAIGNMAAFDMNDPEAVVSPGKDKWLTLHWEISGVA